MLFGSSSDDPTVARRPEHAYAAGRMEPYDHAWREQRSGAHQDGIADNWWWYKNGQKMLEQVKKARQSSAIQ